MNAFRFRLDPVLDARKRTEDERRVVVSEIERKLNTEITVRAELELSFEKLTEKLRSSHAKLDNDELRGAYAHADFLSRSIRARELMIVTISIELEHARHQLAEALKERRIMETLKDRKREVFVNEILRKEQAGLDDANDRRSMKETR